MIIAHTMGDGCLCATSFLFFFFGSGCPVIKVIFFLLLSFEHMFDVSNK